MEDKLTQIDLENLSAYMDGELADPERARITELLRGSPAWIDALRRLQSVGRAMEAYAVPPAPEGLADRVLRKTSHAHRAVLLPKAPLRWLAPLAAAAAIFAAILIFQAANRPGRHNPNIVSPSHKGVVVPSPAPQPGEQPPLIDDEEAYPDLDLAVENFAEDNLDFLRDMGVVNNLETIEAIYSQQSRGEGT